MITTPELTGREVEEIAATPNVPAELQIDLDRARVALNGPPRTYSPAERAAEHSSYVAWSDAWLSSCQSRPLRRVLRLHRRQRDYWRARALIREARTPR